MDQLDQQLSCIDTLDRAGEARSFAAFLIKEHDYQNRRSIDASHVVCVSADWGQGKTTFLKLLGQHLKNDHFVFYFDSWTNDFSEDALSSFFAEFLISLENFVEGDALTEPEVSTLERKGGKGGLKRAANVFAKSAAPIIASHFTKKLTGLATDQLKELIEEYRSQDDDESEDINEASTSTDSEGLAQSVASKAAADITKELTSQHRKAKSARTSMREALETLATTLEGATNYSTPLFVLVDELDRCRPSYAIELLESVKHLFASESVVYVVATNSDQLCHSISAIYGEKFDSKSYLKRFFNHEYRLREVDRKKFAEGLLAESEFFSDSGFYTPFHSLCATQGRGGFDEKQVKDLLLGYAFGLAIDMFDLGLRDIEQIASRLRACAVENGDQVDFFLLATLLAADHKQSGAHKLILDGAKEKDSLIRFYRRNVKFEDHKRQQGSYVSPPTLVMELLMHYAKISDTRGEDIENERLGSEGAKRLAATRYRDARLEGTMREYYSDLVERLQRFSI